MNPQKLSPGFPFTTSSNPPNPFASKPSQEMDQQSFQTSPAPPLFSSSSTTGGLFGTTFQHLKQGAFKSQLASMRAVDQVPAPCIEFDPHGDLRLIVGNGADKKVVVVDSRTLCRASSTFRRMLSGNFAEAKPEEGLWYVKLPDDKFSPFSVLMDMIHGQSERTPAIPSIDLLYEIVDLADKYDMIRTLRPMAAKWLSHYKQSSASTALKPTAMLLFISWELGDRALFRALIVRLADEVCEVFDDLDHHLSIGAISNPVHLEDVPEIDRLGIMTTLNDQREHRLQVIRDECQKLACALLHPDHPNGTIIHTIIEGHRSWVGCQESLLARLMSGASSHDLLSFFIPSCRESDTPMSVKTVLLKLEDIRQAMTTRLICDPMQQTLELIKQRKISKSLLLPGQTAYLNSQALKTGLPEPVLVRQPQQLPAPQPQPVPQAQPAPAPSRRHRRRSRQRRW